MTADEPVAGVPRLCARSADCTRPRGHDDDCGPDRDQARVARYAAALSSARLDAVLKVADTELAEARAEVERLEERALGDEQCCPDVCNGGACESCPGCCAGWCVNGHDFSPGDWEDVLDPESRERWWDVARQHNLGIDAALRRAEKAEAERDALQRQVDAVRALVPSPNQPGRWVLPDDEDAPAVWVYDIDAALDAVEPADQPRPTPEADECIHTPEHSRTLCGYCGEQESWCLDCGEALHKCGAGA